MDNLAILKILALAGTAPWWLPVIRGVWKEMWVVSAPGAEAEARTRTGVDYEQLGWAPDLPSGKRLENTRWSTGRRAVVRQPTSFRNR